MPFGIGAAEEADDVEQLTDPNFNTQPTHAINSVGDIERVESGRLDFVFVVVERFHLSSKMRG